MSVYTSSGQSWTESRPDKPLVVVCYFDGDKKRITFHSSRTCSYDLFRTRVEQCFSLSATSYAITYTDDDGETNHITTDTDLTDAILYFRPPPEDVPISSAASILSGRSFGKGKITMKVKISVDYDGPSLSDTSSLISLEEYKNRNDSTFSLSYSSSHSKADIDDDAITVSSKDMGSKYEVFRARGPKTIMSGPSREPLIQRPPPSTHSRWEEETVSSVQLSSRASRGGDIHPRSHSPVSEQREVLEHTSYLDDPSEAFAARLRLQENQNGEASGSGFPPTPLHSGRGAEWLRDQNARTIKTMLGDLPEPSLSDELSVTDPREGSVMSGELALQQDPRGKFYYAYTSGTGSSAVHSSSDSGYDDASSLVDDADAGLENDRNSARNRPTSMQIRWLQSQAVTPHPTARTPPRLPPRLPPRPSSSNGSSSAHRSNSEPVVLRDLVAADIPPELLPFIPSDSLPPPADPTDCSNCGTMLIHFRYVCATCGEKKPKSQGLEHAEWSKGKSKAGSTLSGENGSAFPSPPFPGTSPSVSTWTLVADENPFHDSNAIKSGHKPLPALPSLSPPLPARPSPYLSASSSMGTDSPKAGYELCFNCLESVGVMHALESCIEPGSSPVNDWPPSSEDAQRALSQMRRAAPKRKGQLRHAYVEKVWGPRGWDDVEPEDYHHCRCSTCNITIMDKRYKCWSCQNFNLCRACYSQVHEIHPAHTFLVVPEKPHRSRSAPALNLPTITVNQTGERSMTHPGVKCAHCMLDIVGARFHCAFCPSVDICSNCESAGLPGNLDSSDGGHNSSHIMIKIPYPLPSDELQIASQRAQQLWDRDALNVEGRNPRSRRNSLLSSYARTVVGPASSMEALSVTGESDSHGITCDQCNKMICGTRFQCATCVSVPKAYNLCSQCEPRSYAVHDPMHIFFKLPRPVKTPIECEFAMLPHLYKVPAGPPGAVYNQIEPGEYLQTLLHPSAVCDRCMLRITGEWFRCVYCAKDLCDSCEAVDTHDSTHFFMVFKSSVDMQLFRLFAQLENPAGSPPVVPYPVY